MLAPIRLTNAAAQLVLRTQVRRKETHPHHPSAPPPPLRGLSNRSQISIRYGLSAPVPGGDESSLPAPRGNVGHYSAARYERRQGAALRQVGWPQYPGRREPPGDQRQIQPDIQL